MRAFMNFQLQNYDNIIRGDAVQQVSLHRVFIGSSGVGKTTVARLYGRLLKEFGYLSDGDFIEVKPNDLTGQAQGEAASHTAAILERAKGKVLFIDEAYILDPTRSGNKYGGEVIDTLVAKLTRSGGSDIAVILAGYDHEMKELFKNANNQGFPSRFNMDDAVIFEDFSDDDIKHVLLNLIRSAKLCIEMPVLDFAVQQISLKRNSDGFANAAEAQSSLNRAILNLTARKQAAFEAKTIVDKAKIKADKLSAFSGRGGTVPNSSSSAEVLVLPTQKECECDPYELIRADFVIEENSAENARDAFADLENVQHIMVHLQELEDTMNQAKREGKTISDILDKSHMTFIGPPGTGKTTVAQRFGIMFKNLELLGKKNVEVVTAQNLLSRYQGGTAPNVVDAMRRAKGGILFIDETYAIAPRYGSYGGDAVQAFVDNITLPEFAGKIILIFAGYRNDMEDLFKSNAGFRSRFQKVTIEFPEWSVEMAVNATVKKIETDGDLKLTPGAKEWLPKLYSQLYDLPDWGSARDVYDHIIPALYSKRSSRLGKLARMEKIQKSVGNNDAVLTIAPYEDVDVKDAFSLILKDRQFGKSYNEKRPSVSTKIANDTIFQTDSVDACEVFKT